MDRVYNCSRVRTHKLEYPNRWYAPVDKSGKPNPLVAVCIERKFASIGRSYGSDNTGSPAIEDTWLLRVDTANESALANTTNPRISRMADKKWSLLD